MLLDPPTGINAWGSNQLSIYQNKLLQLWFWHSNTSLRIGVLVGKYKLNQTKMPCMTHPYYLGKMSSNYYSQEKIDFTIANTHPFNRGHFWNCLSIDLEPPPSQYLKPALGQAKFCVDRVSTFHTFEHTHTSYIMVLQIHKVCAYSRVTLACDTRE